MAQSGRTVIQLRCDVDVKRAFKAISGEFGTYEDALKAFIKEYRRDPKRFHGPSLY